MCDLKRTNKFICYSSSCSGHGGREYWRGEAGERRRSASVDLQGGWNRDSVIDAKGGDGAVRRSVDLPYRSQFARTEENGEGAAAAAKGSNTEGSSTSTASYLWSGAKSWVNRSWGVQAF